MFRGGRRRLERARAGNPLVAVVLSVNRGGPGRTGWARRLGRVLLASQFIYGGYHAAKEPGRRPEALDKAGVPGGADLVRVNGAAMVVGGVALGLGVLPRLASAGLIASMVPTTLVGHPFWREREPAARQAQAIQFLKNASMVGGLLLEVGGASPAPSDP